MSFSGATYFRQAQRCPRCTQPTHTLMRSLIELALVCRRCWFKEGS